MAYPDLNDPALEALMQQMALPDDERKRLLLGNMLLGIGGGLMQGKRGNEIGALGSGAVVGAQMGQQAISDARKGLQDKLKTQMGLQEYLGKQRASEAQSAFNQRLSDVDSNPQAGMASRSGSVADAQQIPKQWELAMRKAQMAADNGDVKRAEEYRKAAEFYRVKYGLTPQTLMRDGKPVVAQMSEYGDIKEADGYSPKPEYQKVETGKETMFYDPLTKATGGSFAMQTTPGQDQTNATLIRGQNMTDARMREGNTIAREGTISGKVGEFRKEFNSLPQVKAYGEVQPVLQSAREAVGTDTAAADLNLIYAAAKIMDPTSVVRESETQMVVGSGSPAQRFMGQFNYVAGGGRLTPDARKALMVEVESRGRGYESGYKAARKAYEGIAVKNNIPADQVFIEPFAGSAPSPAAPAGAPVAGPTPGAVVGGYRFKGGDPNKRENWVKV